MGVLGKANESIISGAVICRGTDYKGVMEAAPDCELSGFLQGIKLKSLSGESYKYKKIDLSNPADKEFFEAAMAWDLTIDGKEWADGKNFK